MIFLSFKDSDTTTVETIAAMIDFERNAGEGETLGASLLLVVSRTTRFGVLQYCGILSRFYIKPADTALVPSNSVS